MKNNMLRGAALIGSLLLAGCGSDSTGPGTPFVSSDFEITTLEVVAVPASLRPNVSAAIARWEAAVTGDLPDVQIASNFFGPEGCGGYGEEANGKAVDDVLILVNIDEIDGPGNILGQAGPCGIRSTSQLPFVGILTLDSDDLEAIAASSPEAATDIIAHEMGHVLGYGSLWETHGLVTGAGTSDPRFTGAGAVAEYQALGGSGNVPLETGGGEGTAEVHWSEDDFDTELMTGFAEQPGTEQPLSRVSIASLADLGYVVDLGAADPYTLPSGLLPFRGETAGASHGHLGYDVVYLGPVQVLERDGSVTTIQLH